MNVTTQEVSEKSATVDVITTVTNGENTDADLILSTELFNANGYTVSKVQRKVTVVSGIELEINQELIIENLALWSAELPNFYTAKLYGAPGLWWLGRTYES